MKTTETDLLDAGWRVIDSLGMPDCLGGFTAAQVSAEAGVSTGSLFHHFANMDDFADALILTLALDDNVYSEPDTALEHIETENVLDIVHRSLKARWIRHTTHEGRLGSFRHELLAVAVRSRELGQPTAGHSTVADVLKARFDARERDVTEVWTLILESVGRTVAEPFTPQRLSTAMTSLFSGLAVRKEVDPELIDDDLFADVGSALIAALSKPVGSERDMAAVSEAFGRILDPGDTPQAISGAKRRAETRAHIVLSSMGMFSSGWETVSASEIADRAGVSNQTITNVFGDVRSVAATTFAPHAVLVRQAAEAAQGQDPISIVRVVLTELANCCRADPEPARALLAERLAVITRLGERMSVADIRLEVPLTDHLRQAISDGGLHPDPITMARALVHTVISQSLLDMEPPEDVAEMALRLISR